LPRPGLSAKNADLLKPSKREFCGNASKAGCNGDRWTTGQRLPAKPGNQCSRRAILMPTDKAARTFADISRVPILLSFTHFSTIPD
jgi:hypothetical protein